MSEDRRLRVLRAIVQDYVQTSEPVGSKALLERHHLGVSAATVRNDMAALEEEGLIAAPHTSAGRVPTDAGYRLFVDRLSAVKPLSAAEQRAIAQFLEGAVDLDDVVDRTVRLLASLTRQVAVVQYPSLRPLVGAPRRAGADRRRAACSSCSSPPRVASSSGSSRSAPTCSATTARAPCPPCAPSSTRHERAHPRRGGHRAVAVPEQLEPGLRDLVRSVVTALEDSLVEEREERVVLAGTANLARVGTDFTTSLGPVLEALEEHVVLLKLLGTVAEQGGSVAVRIGHENPYAGLHDHVDGHHRATAPAPTSSPASASSARPGWTTRRRWPVRAVRAVAILTYVPRNPRAGPARPSRRTFHP